MAPFKFLSPDAQVLKARYYPSSSPLEATVDYRSSLTWRSIIRSKDIVQQGYRIRIGSEKMVRIWKDQWLPRPSTYKSTTPPPDGLENAIVVALIDPDSGEWDRPIIDLLFVNEDRGYILGIPLGRADQLDIHCWHYSQNGLFSVKSAYSIARQTDNPSSPSSPNPMHQSVYNAIWYANVPQKIRLFT
ncbi:UNVERIFIED_CONTAM: putative ribonuclease H protein [Sesamum latifolium]|uniref:Ribonuclease H protein n=1 Tax=Sesamum latifolium TaxID=2727402 RepID=A0AAW2WS34_9LAMI